MFLWVYFKRFQFDLQGHPWLRFAKPPSFGVWLPVEFRLIKLILYSPTNMAAQRDLPFVRPVREWVRDNRSRTIHLIVFASLSVPPNMSFGRSVPDLFGGAVPDARRRCIQALVPGLCPQPCQDVQGRGLQVGDAGLRERDYERKSVW